jgi:hypothetical protein
MEFILTLAVISPLSLCSRTSIVQAWGRSHYLISDKSFKHVSIMLQKVLRSKRKKMKMKKKYDEKKRKVRKIGRIK